MMEKMEKLAELLRNQRRSWGIHIFRAGRETSPEQYLEIYRETPGGRSLVGSLSQEEEKFVFRYDPDYRAEPISAFPDLAKEYRSEELWPFFSVRIPPIEREDMREAIAARNIKSDQPIELLGKVAKFSVTNPYEFQLNNDNDA